VPGKYTGKGKQLALGVKSGNAEIPLFLLFFFLAVLGLILGLRAFLALARQVLYRLSHASGPFRFSYFLNRVSHFFCPDQLGLLFCYLCLFCSYNERCATMPTLLVEMGSQ
jgi:hypothetical protein